MGWTSINASNYDKHGKVDIVKECNNILTWDSTEYGSCRPIKTAKVGSIVYSAVERTKVDGTRIIFASVIRTSVNHKDYYNFSYKDMDETEGPCFYDCPMSIINLLSPTENDYANAWRRKCIENNEEKLAKKRDFDSLNNLPIGSVIKFHHWDGKDILLTKRAHYRPKTIWYDGYHYRYTTSQIERYGYVVVSKGVKTK